ncbi:MAG: SH3 domain-containing protein [Lachnospiraceae bacterium]|nr:SH3 domain-containing protein [Lachnospiraceae bacterium]
MKKKIIKKKSVFKLWILMAMVLCFLGNSPLLLQVRAQEQTVEEKNQIMTAKDSIEALAEPVEQAESVHTYEAGDSVFVTGETANGWYQVTYQNVIGYVPVSSLTEMELDVEGLDEEFRVEEEEGKLVVEVVERKRAEIKRARIWGTIIVVLVIGIFALGIFSAIKANKADKEEQDGDKIKEPAINETKETGKSDAEGTREDSMETELKTDQTENKKSEITDEIMDLDQE